HQNEDEDHLQKSRKQLRERHLDATDPQEGPDESNKSHQERGQPGPASSGELFPAPEDEGPHRSVARLENPLEHARPKASGSQRPALFAFRSASSVDTDRTLRTRATASMRAALTNGSPGSCTPRSVPPSSSTTARTPVHADGSPRHSLLHWLE